MKILFLGNPNFYPWYRDALARAGHDLSIPERGEQLAEAAERISPDLGVIAYYGAIIARDVLTIPQHGFINIHPSLLPAYRGPSPVRTAIINGERVTGVTIHVTTPKVDAGDIIAQKEFPILSGDTYTLLEERLFREGADLLSGVVDPWMRGEIIGRPQDEARASYTKKVTTADGKIDWSESALTIERKIRALNPEPGTFTFLAGKRLIISSARAEEKPHAYPPGTVLPSEAGFKIAARGGYITPLRVKLEGKKELDAAAFARGQRNLIEAVLD